MMVASSSEPARVLRENERPLAIVVDDAPRVREVVANFLAEAGFAAVTTTDDAVVMEWAHTRRPAVIVVDLMMPDVDGGMIISWLRRNPATANVPIVAISGRDEELREAQRAFGRSGMAYLRKPFTREELQRAVEEAGGVSPHGGSA
jgi:two-component system, chemotaxis family, response regulator PixH